MTNVELIRKVQKPFLQAERPELKTGMEVEVSQIIKEGNKERIQKFKGIIIKIAGKSELEKTIMVRRKVGPFGVEKIFAIHSPSIQKIEILRQFKVKRKSIKYIRDLTGNAAKLKEVRKNNEVEGKKTTKKTAKPTNKVEPKKTEPAEPQVEEVEVKKETPSEE